jgi:hypothetical protein
LIGFPSFALRDAILSWIVLFIVPKFRALSIFENTQNCVRMLLRWPKFLRKQKDAFCFRVRSAGRRGIHFIKVDPARSRSPLLDFAGEKQSRYRRDSRRKDRHHLQTRRTHFEQAQRGKPHLGCVGSTRSVPLGRTRTRKRHGSAQGRDLRVDRDAAPTVQRWCLRNLRCAFVLDHVMQRTFGLARKSHVRDETDVLNC